MPDAPPALPLVHRVLAGPGSGKTRLLIRELRHRLEHGYPPASLLGITFTRRAAHEMRTRLRAPLLHGEAEIVAIAPWIGTFHALARRIQAETGRLRQPLDLNTLIPEATTTLQEGALPSWIPALRFIAVDEAQDLDSTQIRFLLELRRHASNCELLVVGDPDQAIYGFRQASPHFLLRLPELCESPCRTLTLSENHRSARRIVETARAILSPSSPPLAPGHTLIPTRPEAHPAIRHLTADSREEEAALILSEVRTMLAVGVSLSHQAILVRTRAQLAPLRQEATRWNLPIYTPPADERLDGPRPHAVPEDALTVLTIHQAKGGEWTVVYLAGCQDGLLPHVAAKTHEAYEEERRLLYVAVTRAKQLLWICRHGPPSPFLEATLRDPFDMTEERDLRHRTVEHREGWLKRLWGWIAVT